jgi:hypothetical protein
MRFPRGVRGYPKSLSHRHCERSEAIQNTWIVSGCALAMTRFSGLLHCVRNDGQRWFASIYDYAFCYVLTKRHFACSSGTKRLLAMTETVPFEAPPNNNDM